MKLANKYELLDPLTTGAVETFVARELATGQRVLVHVFEGGGSTSDPPTSDWALEGLGKLAPTPPGEVIDVGRYPGSTFAYLVTRVPVGEVLQKWVLAYEAHGQPTPEPAAVTAAIPSQGGTRPPGSEPGLGTAVFFSPAKPADTSSTTPKPRDTASTPVPVATPGRTPTRPKESFTGMFQSAGTPVESRNAGAPASDGKSGEFTSFFRGPFTGKASETPNMAPPLPPPEPDSRPGEFTQIFGARRGSPQEAPAEPSVRTDAPLNEPGGFTQLFASPSPASSEFAAPPLQAEEKPVSSENPFIFDTPTWKPQINTLPPTPAPPKNPFESLPAGGPSEYTMIVSGGMRAPAAPDEPPMAAASNPPGAKPAAFAMPKAPAIPPMPVPKMPAAPAMPAVPPTPKMPALAVPKAPQAPDAPKPPMSYLPLILIMTVLFFVGAMLVLYFALKH